MVLVGVSGEVLGQAGQEGSSQSLNFDHNTTGFILDNAHRTVSCESCHTAGTFRGTPRTCATCHVGAGGRAPGRSLTHIPTAAIACENCHNTTNWTSARMNHSAATSVACSTCHSGSYVSANAQGASRTTHIPIANASCDSCHTNTTTFAPAAMNHTGTSGRCISCHNGSFVGQNAQAKPSAHPETTLQCDSAGCHNSTTIWFATSFDHSAAVPPVEGRCISCHNGLKARGKQAAHLPTTAQCDSCHSNTLSFAGARMNHTGTNAQCSTCHSGTYTAINALAKPTTHVATSSQCDTCHQSTVTWAGARFDHTTVTPPVAGRCATCHNGTTAVGKAGTHLPTTAGCDTCHTDFTAFAPARMNHAGTNGPLAAGNCKTCHTGAYVSINAQVQSATHIVDTRECDACHSSTTTWATATFNHATATPAVTNRCSSCHNNTNTGIGKPTSHIPTTVQCDSCHTNQTAFRPAAMRHDGTTTNCSSCHNGNFVYANASGKAATHIPTSAECSTCHTGTTTFTPATMSHANTAGPVAAGNCRSCHNGSYLAANAQGMSATHIATTAQCDSCHKTTTAWLPTAFDHTLITPPVAGRCATCHNGTQARGKAASHLPTAAGCDTCHTNFAAFAPATMNHGATTGPSAIGNCATCHSGAFVTINAQVKTPTHVGTTAQCDSCHASTTTWATATFNHANASPPAPGNCAVCHNGTTALGKPTNHIPTTATCDACHNNFTAFAPAVMDHQNTNGPAARANCSSCHNGGYLFANALAKPSTHLPTTAQCDTCHTGGYTTWQSVSFVHAASAAGTCSTCHNGSTAIGKSSSHVPTTAQCDTCHTNYLAFKPARMNHAGSAGQCSTCHSGGYVAANALAKPTSHIPTGAQCDTCHSTGFVSFQPSPMNHAGTNAPLAAGNCSTCHSGAYLAQNAQVKPATHVATTAQCDTCHRSTTSWATATFNHAATTPPVAGRCSTCHVASGGALAKPSTHIPTGAQCDTCHNTFTAFSPATMNHAGTTAPSAAGNCATCHGGSYVSVNARAKPATHIATTAQCDSCHTSSAWLPTTFAHTGVAAGSCATCHNGTGARGKAASHLPTTAACDSCHTNFASFSPAAMNHTGTAGTCLTCHTGTYLSINAQIKPATHISTTAQCDACHTSTTSWAATSFNHANVTPAVAGRCSTCHNGTAARGKTPTHVVTTAQCDTCHNSTVSWATATFVHDATVIGRCSTCHNSTIAIGKPTNHIPTTAQCSTCHNSYTAFRPAEMNHAATAGPAAVANCSTCHSGAYLAVNALTKPANHIPTTGQCDSCHKAGYVNWSPVTMNHTGQTSCSTCHGGAYVADNAQTKPATHIATTAQCSTCHNSTTTWATGTFNHAGVAAGSCANCHNGTNALGKPTNHIPTSATCDTCHKNFTAFAPATMDHTRTTGPLATANCSSCHSGAYTFANARAKPATHVATTVQCDTCHKSTASWSSVTFAHAATAVGTCSTCHNNTTAIGKPATTHVPTTAQCDTCHNNYIAFKPANMSHVGTTGQCSTCHNGSFTAANALAKSVSHIPTTSQCDTCHNTGFVSFVPATMNHAAAAPATAGNCSTCHGGAYVSQNALTKHATHIATTAQCDTCHRSTTSWATATLNHATVTPAVAGRCSSCHNSTNALGKPSNHIPTTAQCDSCHNTFTAFAPANMTHNAVLTPPGGCTTCHSGAYVAANARAKPATHIVTTAQCDSCHTTAAWLPTTFNHAAVTPPVAGRCATCHNGTTARGKLASHLPTTASCDVCHTNVTTFAPATMNHGSTTGPVAAANCSTCHSGAYLSINAQVKTATHVATSAQCDTCHRSTTTWANATFAHDATAVGRCATCHNGTTALGKPTTHVPTTAQCSTCHNNYTAFRPAVMNHAATTGPVAVGNCATCHGGAYVAVNATAKPALHIPTTSQCDTCHKAGYVAWQPCTMNHTGLTSCTTCHSGAYVSQNALAKPATHVATTAQCSTCHNSTTTWATGTFNHATATPAVAGRCSTCHNSINALGKLATHIPTTAQCDTCHKNFVAFNPATMTHNATVTPPGGCATCHIATYAASGAIAKPVTHVSTTQSCNVCHTTTAWTPATFSHTGVSTNCASCHNGTQASGKPAVHVPTTQLCSDCHRTGLAWLPLKTPIVHPTATACANCHSINFPGMTFKAATHFPTTAGCESCHNTTAWVPATYNHAGVVTTRSAGNCQSCHGGAYPGITVKPGNHIPTTTPAGMPGNECSHCHNSTTTFSAPAGERMNHMAMQTGCKTCHMTGSPYNIATGDRKTLGSHEGSKAADDCSKSGCHKPLGREGTAYTSW